MPRAAIPFCCLMFLKDINHAMFFLNYEISGIAPMTVLLGIMLMRNFISIHIGNLIKSGWLLWSMFILFLVSMIAMGTYSMNTAKYISMAMTGCLAYIAYAHILSNRGDIDFFKFSIYCTLSAVFLLQLNVISNHYGSPSSLLDFGFYRNRVGVDMYQDLAQSGVAYATHYQFFGTVCSFGLTLCMAFTKLNIKQIAILLFLNIIAIGYTGARQYLIILVILFAIYILTVKGNLLGKIIIIIIGMMFVSYIVYQSILSDYINVLTEKGVLAGSGREDLFERGVYLFENNPLTGVGFGGYNYYGDYKAYPHNLIVELLSEVGVLGLFFIFITLYINRSWTCLLYDKRKEIKMFYVVLALFARSMISLSITGNIILFSFMSACVFFNNKIFNITK